MGALNDQLPVLGRCVIIAYEAGTSKTVEHPVIRFDSLDAAQRWFAAKDKAAEPVVTHVRMHNLGAHSGAHHGFQDRSNGITTQFDGELLVITAPTLELLIGTYNRMQQGG